MNERDGRASRAFDRDAPLLAALIVAGTLTGSSAAFAASPAKIPLDYTAYDSWNTLRGETISSDGRWVAYALVPEDGNPTLIVHEFNGGADLHEPRGVAPKFTADGKYVTFTIRAPVEAIHAARRAGQKAPPNGLGVVNLATGSVVTYENVADATVAPDDGVDTLAFTRDAPAASPSPQGAAPGSPAFLSDALHVLDGGRTLTIRNLSSGSETSVPGVLAYGLSHDGTSVLYATGSSARENAGVHLWAASLGRDTVVLKGTGHLTNVQAAPRTDGFAFLSDAASYALPAPHYALYRVDAGDATGAHLLADATTPGIPQGWAPSANASPVFTNDGKRLYFGTAPAPSPEPAAGAREPVKVDIWSWRDDDLQSYQRTNADSERKRTYLAVAHLDSNRIVQLASPTLRDVRLAQSGDVALGVDDGPYRKTISWTSYNLHDSYAVSLLDGRRTLLVKRGMPDDYLSPTGRYLATFDLVKRAWFSVRTSDGKRVNLTSTLHVPFYDELDVEPAPPPPYDFGGWIDGDRYVLVRDRFDVWAIDPATGRARDLTHGYGRAHRLRFTPLQLAPDAESFDSKKPLFLTAFDDVTKDSGLYRLDPEGSLPPQKLFLVPKAVDNVAKARFDDRVILTAQRFDESPNLWTFRDLLGSSVTPSRISDSNPQQARYRWGHARLISYRSTWGVPLRGILITPDGLDVRKRAPMLVFYYERWSDRLNDVPFTIPAPDFAPALSRYVSNGYVVFVPDIAFRVGHPGSSVVGSMLPAINAVLKLGFVDPKRIGVAGHSWGGYETTFLITQTNRFRAAEGGAAVTNMTSAYGEFRSETGDVREFSYEAGQSRIGATPWDRPDLYLENSPLFQIKNVHTPYLTIANDADGSVPQSQGLEFATAMRRLGKEAYLFSFDGEGHHLESRENEKYWTVHLDEFFDHFLLGKAAPAWMLQSTPFLQRGQRDVDVLFGEHD